MTDNYNSDFNFPDVKAGIEILKKYKDEKRALERRIASEENFWKLRQYNSGEQRSAWLFNSIVNKHADIIDNMPVCICLPREQSDEREAEMLSNIIPVICQRSDFEQQYSDNAWEKLKHGTAIYGVFWNKNLEYGLGDIDIRSIDIKDIFWEPGISDIQDSRHLFICGTCERDTLESRYPDIAFSDAENESDALASYLYDGMTDQSGRLLCVDWYTKIPDENGIERLHFCKFVGGKLLYTSTLDPDCADGWYEHGKYPVVFDVMYPDKGSVSGSGLISVASSVQTCIDRLDGNLMEYSDWASKVRFWAKKSLGVNEKDFNDLSKNIIEVEGDIDEEKLRQIEIGRIDDSILELKRLKVEELKEITGCRDVSVGGTTSGVTAASAISLLQEAGSKSSRDGIEGSCRAFIRIVDLIIELIRQFYDRPRCFRIIGEYGESKYVDFSGEQLRDKVTETEYGKIIRRPIFDIEIKTGKRNPTQKQNMNTFAMDLYSAGAFSPENAKQTLIMLEMMDFDGIGRIKQMLKKISSSEKAEG